MKKNIRAKIKAATVRFTKKGGQGVLVPGQMIVTAAHCVRWSTAGEMTLGDHYIERVKAGARILKVKALAVELVADIAILGALDDQELPDEAKEFEDFCESTAPVPICTADFPLFRPFPVHILAHTGRWIPGQAEQGHVNAEVLWIKTSEGIEGGTSGGPVVTDSGLLLGVVSTAGGDAGGPALSVKIPRLHLAAPGWLVRTIVNPEWMSPPQDC